MMKFKKGDKVRLNNVTNLLGIVKKAERMKYFTRVAVQTIAGSIIEYREEELVHFEETDNVKPLRYTEAERVKFVDLIYDMFVHACHTEMITNDNLPMFDHRFISTYVEVQFFLIQEGKITKEQCVYK